MPELSLHRVTHVVINTRALSTENNKFDLTTIAVQATTNLGEPCDFEMSLFSSPGAVLLHSQEAKPAWKNIKFNSEVAAICVDFEIQPRQLLNIYIDTVIDSQGEYQNEDCLPDWVFDIAHTWLDDLTVFEATIAMQSAFAKYQGQRPGSLLPVTTADDTHHALLCVGMQALQTFTRSL